MIKCFLKVIINKTVIIILAGRRGLAFQSLVDALKLRFSPGSATFSCLASKP